MTTRVFVVLALAVLLHATAALAAQPVAVVTALKGTVRIDGKPARLLQAVPLGARVLAGDESTATLSYVCGGVRVHLSGPCTYVAVASPPASRPADGVFVLRSTTGTTALLPDRVNVDRMGGVRPASPVMLHVGRTMDLAEPFEWRSTRLYAEYVVHIEGPGLTRPFEEVVNPGVASTRTDTDDKTWNIYRYGLPSDIVELMKPGATYELRLTAAETRGARGDTFTATFKAGDPQEMAVVKRQALPMLEQVHRGRGETATALEVAALYLGHDMMFAAWHAIEACDVDTPEMRRLIRAYEEATAGQQARPGDRTMRRTP